MMKVLWSEQMIVNLLTHKLLAAGAGLLLGLAGNVAWAQNYVNATVDGQLAPGVYGRIQIGNGGPPPLIYAEPVIIQRPPVAVHRSPIYMYVPPGHAKNWAKHCGRYNACGQPVYFVKEPGSRPPKRGGHHAGPRDGDHRHGHRDDRHPHGNGRGHGGHKD